MSTFPHSSADENKIQSTRASRHSIHLRLALATGLILAHPLVATAGLIGDGSWTRESEDGRYLLVMLYDGPQEPDQDYTETNDLNKKYRQSGVYVRENANVSLFWKMPYQSSAYSVHFSQDGEHLLLSIPAGHHTSDVPPWGALHFFHKDGSQQHWLEYELTWGWMVKELLYIYLRRSWDEWSATEFDPNANTFTVRTNHAEDSVFDVTTGRKLHTYSDWDLWAAVFLVCIPAVIYGFHRTASTNLPATGRPRIWQVSLAEILLLMLVGAVLLTLARFSIVLSAAVVLIGLGGGAIAQLIARGRLSWWIGGLTAVYGAFIGLVLFGTFGELLIWRVSWLNGYVILAVLVGSSRSWRSDWCTGGWIVSEAPCVRLHTEEVEPVIQ